MLSKFFSGLFFRDIREPCEPTVSMTPAFEYESDCDDYKNIYVDGARGSLNVSTVVEPSHRRNTAAAK